MSQRHGWDIRTRMLAISLGPALLLTLLLTAYFTYSRLQDLRQELTHTGQLIADQLAPAAEYGVIAGNTPVLQKLLQATLDTPHVRFIEVRDRNDNILVYVEQLPGALQNAAPIDIFHSTIQRQRIALASDPLLDGASEGDGQSGEDYLGRVVVGMSNDAFSQRQQEILLKAALLAAFALILTFLVARRLAQRLSAPISTMGQAVEAIQSGDYKTSLPILDDGEIGDLARHINNLASGLDRASREQEQAISQLISAREEAEQAQPGEVRLPGDDEPRASHPDEWRAGHAATAGNHRADPRTGRVHGAGHRVHRTPAEGHQRHSRFLKDRTRRA